MPRSPLDLYALDRDVERAVRHLGLHAAGSKSRHAAASHFPENLRHTATQATYVALGELTPSRLDEPLKAGLTRWVYELLQARVGEDLAIADAEAANAIDARLGLRARKTLASRELRDNASHARSSSSSSWGPTPTYNGAWSSVVHAQDASKSAAALSLAGELAAPVAAVRRERQARRFEVSRRLGLASPWELATRVDGPRAAGVFLDATESFAASLLKTAQATSQAAGEVPWSASSAILSALARDAHHGWPAHLGVRWLEDVFKDLAKRGAGGAVVMPEALGGASFVRAAAAWGFAWRTNGTPRTMPFALARDPYPTSAFRFGFVLAQAMREPAFQTRALDVSARVAAMQSRALGITMLHDARLCAIRVALAADENASPSRFEELTSRVFGAPLPASMRGAWPIPNTADLSRLVALLETQAFANDLVARFDSDWFRNPRAGAHLGSLACGPAFDDALFSHSSLSEETAPNLDDRARAVACAFERALG